MGTAVAAEHAFVAVLDGRRLRVVASYPAAPSPDPLVVAAAPMLASALQHGEPVALGAELAPLFGGSAHLVLPLSAEGSALGAVVLADSPMPPEAAIEMLAGAIPLAAAHVRTWRDHHRLLGEIDHDIGIATTVRRIVDDVSDAIRVVDLDGRVVRWNTACERLLGWTEEEVLGKFLPALPNERRTGMLAQLRRLANTMEPFECRAENVRKDGSRVRVSIQTHPVLDEHGEFRAVQVLRETGADTRVDRLREEFCDLVTGSLKGPLTAITGFGQLLRRSEIVEDPARRLRVLDSLQAQTGVLSSMIDDILLLSEVQHGPPVLERTEVDLVALVTESVAEAERGHPGCKFIVDVESRVPRVSADGPRVRQAVAHLLANAATYAAPAGEVCVTVARMGQDVVIAVSDDGEGIPAEELEGVFHRFTRGSRARGQGTGVGLHVVRLIAEAHGGSTTLESTPGKGSRAILRLPLPA